MNELFAIEPTAFDDHKDLKILLSKFGFHEGRFIAKYPSNWFTRVHAHLNSLPDIERSRSVDVLQRYKEGRFISGGLPWIENNDWLQNAASLKQEKKVADVIVARGHAGEFQSIDVDETYFHRNWGGRQSKVMSNADGYASAASMMLRLSHEVAIIDPYIFKNKYQDRLKRVINKFADIAKTGKCRRFIIFTLVDSNVTTDSMVEKWALNCLGDACKSDISISLYLLQDIDKLGADDHARHLVSAKGAMYFDKGFIEESVPRLRFVGFHDLPTHEDLRRQYLDSEAALPFKITHRFHLGITPSYGAL